MRADDGRKLGHAYEVALRTRHDQCKTSLLVTRQIANRRDGIGRIEDQQSPEARVI